MEFEHSTKVKELQARVSAFMEAHIYPNEKLFDQQLDEGDTRWQIPPVMEELKAKAKADGLWNMFLPDSERGFGLSNLEYGNDEHKRVWLEPLLNGEIRSAFAMTEPRVASSDATNIESNIKRDGDDYIINGRKWWTSGIGDPRCKVLIFMGKTDPDNPDRHKQQSMVVVPVETPGIKVLRTLPVFGYDDAPHGHGEVEFKDVRVPASNILLGEGRGFEIAQGRLGPGRIHHCMRQIGVAERALEKMLKRVKERTAFGKSLAERILQILVWRLSRPGYWS